MKFDNKEDILFLTQDWKGDRFEDGRPRVSDSLIERLRNVTTEEAAMALYSRGYTHQFEGAFKRTNDHYPLRRLIGRAVTAVMVPSRIDVHMHLLA